MTAKMKVGRYSVEEIFGQLDAIPEGNAKRVVLPHNGMIVKVSSKHAISFNRLYVMSKERELKCSCCGAVPKYVRYKKGQGLQIIVNGNNYLSIDHIVPQAKGGSWARPNLDIMCQTCNSKKQDTIAENIQIGYDIRTVFNQLYQVLIDYRIELDNLRARIVEKFGEIAVARDEFIKRVWVHIEAVIGHTKRFNLERLKVVAV